MANVNGNSGGGIGIGENGCGYSSGPTGSNLFAKVHASWAHMLQYVLRGAFFARGGHSPGTWLNVCIGIMEKNDTGNQHANNKAGEQLNS